MIIPRPGTPTWIDVWRDGQLAQTMRPSGRLVGNVRLDPAGDALYLEDHDLGVLRRIELGSGAESIVLRAYVSEPAISPSGSLVAYTLVSETDRLCVAPLPAAAAREP